MRPGVRLRVGEAGGLLHRQRVHVGAQADAGLAVAAAQHADHAGAADAAMHLDAPCRAASPPRCRRCGAPRSPARDGRGGRGGWRSVRRGSSGRMSSRPGHRRCPRRGAARPADACLLAIRRAPACRIGWPHDPPQRTRVDRRVRPVPHRAGAVKLAYRRADAGGAAASSLGCARLAGRAARLQVTLYGSLAWTGAGHGTDRAVLAGLAGLEPASADPDAVQALPARVQAKRPARGGRAGPAALRPRSRPCVRPHHAHAGPSEHAALRPVRRVPARCCARSCGTR